MSQYRQTRVERIQVPASDLLLSIEGHKFWDSLAAYLDRLVALQREETSRRDFDVLIFEQRQPSEFCSISELDAFIKENSVEDFAARILKYREILARLAGAPAYSIYVAASRVTSSHFDLALACGARFFKEAREIVGYSEFLLKVLPPLAPWYDVEDARFRKIYELFSAEKGVTTVERFLDLDADGYLLPCVDTERFIAAYLLSAIGAIRTSKVSFWGIFGSAIGGLLGKKGGPKVDDMNPWYSSRDHWNTKIPDILSILQRPTDTIDVKVFLNLLRSRKIGVATPYQALAYFAARNLFSSRFNERFKARILSGELIAVLRSVNDARARNVLIVDLSFRLPPDAYFSSLIESRRSLFLTAGSTEDIANSAGVLYDRLSRTVGEVKAQKIWQTRVFWAQEPMLGKGPTRRIVFGHDDVVRLMADNGSELHCYCAQGLYAKAELGVVELPTSLSELSDGFTELVNFSKHIVFSRFLDQSGGFVFVIPVIRFCVLNWLLTMSQTTGVAVRQLCDLLKQSGYSFSGNPEAWDRFLRFHRRVWRESYFDVAKKWDLKNILPEESLYSLNTLTRGIKSSVSQQTNLHWIRGDFESFLARLKTFLRQSKCFDSDLDIDIVLVAANGFQRK